jgi:hypothetical protein
VHLEAIRIQSSNELGHLPLGASPVEAGEDDGHADSVARHWGKLSKQGARIVMMSYNFERAVSTGSAIHGADCRIVHGLSKVSGSDHRESTLLPHQ